MYEKWFGTGDCNNANVEKFKDGLQSIAKVLESSKKEVESETGEKGESELPERTEWKIKGGGAIHEKITKIAAKKVGVNYGDGLDEGCAWPDVPCDNPNYMETCYSKGGFKEYIYMKKGSIFYESHYGKYQYWHSMAPIGNWTNQQVKNKILAQGREWFNEALIAKDQELALFHIGKLLHMVQDSYSRSHVVRDQNNQILQFQGYDFQEKELHGEADKEEGSKGYNDAIASSIVILKIYKQCNNSKVKQSNAKLSKCTDALIDTMNKIYNIKSGREIIKAGGSLDAFKN